ncbi:MAG: hypothetical protein N2Z85_01265 [Patescibacteria group bacterium]|nr:hypothetical protein [Patescibacteria group bacterium]
MNIFINIVKKIYKFFDKLEDKIRTKLSHWPIIYGFFGGIGVVLFWRGVWHTADYLSELLYFVTFSGPRTIYNIEIPWWDGPISLIIGSVLLLTTGLFVSSFIGNEIIISGLKGEKKITEKTEEELREETIKLKKAINDLEEIKTKINDIEKILKK